MTKRFLLIDLPYRRAKDPELSLGIAFIYTNLFVKKIDVSVHSFPVNYSDFSSNNVVDFIMANNSPNLYVGFGAYVWNEENLQQILNKLVQLEFEGQIILGGPQISYVETGQLEKFYPQATIFVRGYAETAMLRLAQADAVRPVIKGIHYAGTKDLGQVAENDFSTLPSPFLTNILQPSRFVRWITQVGCPYKCAYCQHKEQQRIIGSNLFSWDRINAEINWILDNKVIQDLAVIDPTFNYGPYYLQILDLLALGGYTGKISLQCRFEKVTDQFIKAVKRLNKTAKVVLEFGLQTIHKNEQRIILRANNLKKIRDIMFKLNNKGIEYEVSIIYGLPKQTLESFHATLLFCWLNHAPITLPYRLMLLRGTKLYQQKYELELVESIDIEDIDKGRLAKDISHVVASPSFSEEDWREMQRISSHFQQYNYYNRFFAGKKLYRFLLREYKLAATTEAKKSCVPVI